MGWRLGLVTLYATRRDPRFFDSSWRISPLTVAVSADALVLWQALQA
jgi:hypothetical protein